MDKIDMKKKWENEHNPPVQQYLMKQCQVMSVRCQLMIYALQEIRRNENVINALKQKVLDMYTHWHVNSLWHNDAIWQLRSGSTLAQLMVCCLTASSHYSSIGYVAYTWEQFHKKCWRIQSVTWKKNLHFWNIWTSARDRCVKQLVTSGFFFFFFFLGGGGIWEKMRHTENKYFLWQWDQCYCKQMLLSSRSNIYVVSIINNSNSGFFLLQMPLQIWYSL